MEVRSTIYHEVYDTTFYQYVLGMFSEELQAGYHVAAIVAMPADKNQTPKFLIKLVKKYPLEARDE